MKTAGTEVRGIRFWLRAHRWKLLAGASAVVLIVAAFIVGKATVDTHSSEIATLEAEVGKVESDLSQEKTEVGYAEAEAKTAKERSAELQEELAAERGFQGNGAKQVAEQEYETDYPIGAAGTVGYLTMKPVDIQQEGEKWILTVEAKNTGSEPKSPFCGNAGAVLIDAEGNNYTGEADLGAGSADCASELQPGITETFKGEFKLPPNAKPVAAALFGDYEQEEEAKTWELPH